MASPSPPKPWEQGGSSGTALGSMSASSSNLISQPSSTINTTSSTSDLPALPDRPSNLNEVASQNASAYSAYGANRYGTGTYNSYGGYGTGYGGYSSYGSPYSRLGGGMGGYGGYGGYGGGIYGGGYGPPGNPGDPNSLTDTYQRTTQATFQTVEGFVAAFGGFAQMLESAYMATHSSFFAMVSVAEQFGNLRNNLGSMLGIFALLRWCRTLLAKLTGRPPPADATALTPSAFSSFLGKTPPAADGSPPPPRSSRKPLVVFLLMVFGLPYLMGKLISSLARAQESEAKRQQESQQQQPQSQLDPSKLDFCRVLYDYTPQSQATGIDLAVKKGDLVAVLSKNDPMGNPSEWWRCRARDGKVGYLPGPYLEMIQRRQQPITAGSAPGSRTTTLKGDVERRTKSLQSNQGPEMGKPAEVTADSFMKSGFYN